MAGVGAITVERTLTGTLITRADQYVSISTTMIGYIREGMASSWAFIEDDVLTLMDDVAAYRYRLVPHSPEAVAAELIDRTDR
jgi:hypothetical protein